MAARRRKRAPQTEEYVEGNTVRKVERVPRYEEQERGHQQKRNVSHTVTVRRNQEKALQMNLFSVLLLTVAVICTLYICVSYLKLQSYVYKVATEELGMVYANKDQVRLYNKTESEYVRQYEDIPEQ